MERFIWICVAGGLGCGTRYLITLGAIRALGSSFPYGTLFVNLLGCFLIAAVMRSAANKAGIPAELMPIIVTGFLGGLTTYSSFNFELTTLGQERGAAVTVLYFVLTTAGCGAAGLAGTRAATALFSS